MMPLTGYLAVKRFSLQQNWRESQVGVGITKLIFNRGVPWESGQSGRELQPQPNLNTQTSGE